MDEDEEERKDQVPNLAAQRHPEVYTHDGETYL